MSGCLKSRVGGGGGKGVRKLMQVAEYIKAYTVCVAYVASIQESGTGATGWGAQRW